MELVTERSTRPAFEDKVRYSLCGHRFERSRCLRDGEPARLWPYQRPYRPQSLTAKTSLPVYPVRGVSLHHVRQRYDGELGGPYNQPSAVSPNYFKPSIYTVRINRTMLFGGALFENVAPAPATAIGAVVRNGWKKPVIGGDRVTRAVRPFTQWRTYSGGASN